MLSGFIVTSCLASLCIELHCIELRCVAIRALEFISFHLKSIHLHLNIPLRGGCWSNYGLFSFLSLSHMCVYVYPKCVNHLLRSDSMIFEFLESFDELCMQMWLTPSLSTVHCIVSFSLAFTEHNQLNADGLSKLVN